jgi:hypothetical protein
MNESKTKSDVLCNLRDIFLRVETIGMSQFTIDFQQEMLGIEELYDPNKIGSLTEGKNYLGSLSYTCENILDIMKNDAPDRKFFEVIVFLCENIRLHDFDFKEKS